MYTPLRYPSTERDLPDGCAGTGDRSPDRPAPRPFDLGDVARFASPLARMLLASDGLTTTLLESALATPLRLRVLHQGTEPAAAQDALTRRCLSLGREEQVLVRRSALADAALTPVSLNTVVGLVPDDPALAACLTSPRTPIGYGLRAAGSMRSRRLVEVGVAGWEQDGRIRPAVFKSYVVLDGERPWLFIRELFNPRLVPAGLVDDGPANSRPDRLPPGGEPAPVPPQPVVVPAPPARQRLLGRPRPLTEEIQGAGPAVDGPHPALAPTADGEAFLLHLGRHATGALTTVAAGLVRYAAGVPVTVVTGGHPPPGVLPREARWIAEEYRTSAGPSAWLGDFPQLMTFLDACPPAVAGQVHWTADGERVPRPGAVAGLRPRPGCHPRAVAMRCAALNPGRVPGRLVLAVRLAPDRMLAELPALIEAVACTGTPVTWVCAPRHGTETATAEVGTFFDIHYSVGSRPGGLLLDEYGRTPAEVLRTVHAAADAWRPAG
ncbi:3-deoxy-7-phosphoheptulonate synthase [Streptomyces rimosus]|uniref:3-deoxy-7-phosphoheptulonate synthase n=1 Tax=Streptomyces rimosus TaxID=1927 RepID=UPI00067C4F9D|nr:3-deoxy-7-phosphoheptulonate synthase [Streptomyces rimosus]